MIYLLHNIGEGPTSNYDSQDKVISSTGVLTFDGVYESVYENRELLEGREVILFVTGCYVGGDNSFDEGQPLERFCDWNQIIELAEDYDAEIGWHSWTHRDLTTLSEDDIEKEVTPPPWLRCRAFAYPYGRFNEVVESVVARHYDRAYSVGRGGKGKYQIQRRHL